MNQETPIAGRERQATMFAALPPVRIALLIGLATVAADQIAGVVDLRRTSAALDIAITAQEQPLQQARRIEAQLDSLATGSARLAQGGNVRAQAIVARLQASGVSIDAGAQQPAE